MVPIVNRTEWSILLGKPINSSRTLGSSGELSANLVNGKYKLILTSEAAKTVFGTNWPAADPTIVSLVSDLDISSYVGRRVAEYLDPTSVGHDIFAIRQLEVLVLGAACLNSFVQTGWTGPALNIEPHDLLPEIVRPQNEKLAKKALGLLSTDGEDVYHLAPRLLYLQYALVLLNGNPNKNFPDLKTARWWAYRALFLQQRILDNGAASLHDAILDHLKAIEEVLSTLPADTDASDIYVRYQLEYGLVHHWYHQDKDAFTHFKLSQEKSGLTWSLTGVMGRRTKFQTFDVSQLTLLAESKRSEDENPQDNHENGVKPENLPLNDDTLLEKIAFTDKQTNTDPANQSNLRIIDQALLLAFCLNVKNTNPDHGITTEQMVPYVTRVLENPNNWMVYTMALLLRSRLEAHRSRTVERAVLQLQALVDQIPTEDSTTQERLAYFYEILLPSKWELERELADKFVSLGVLRSALEIYLRLEVWEDVVSCYRMLDQPDKAKKLVLEQLSLNPNSPKLHCILGDVEVDPKHWQHAWEISNHRFARAMRSLGGYYYKNQEYRLSMECYENAVRINPLFDNSWYVMGCAAMQIEEWETASRAFLRVVNLDNDNAEAWNNLASIMIKQGKKVDALQALKQAVRLKHDNWQIWQNYLYCAIDVGEFAEAIRAMCRIVDLRWEKVKEGCVDVEILNLIVSGVTRDLKDAQDRSVARLARQVQSLLEETITSRITGSSEIWRSCATFYMWQGEYVKALDSQVKAYRCVVHNPKLETDRKVFDEVAKEALETVEMYQNVGEKTVKKEGEDGVEQLVCKDWRYQSRSLLKTLLGRTKSTWEDTETYEKLQQTLKELRG
ncbi:hypothetical protein BC938DRAFT_481788 [Jimgerdemannia flammicorona]|uniref:TPR-like protein n=1 Tax=Jimgerdemannia flammicorona TaxID=994334 RepID=A0A433QFD9_9FUNG|nr:hypothetical protein BC938DRAFT_481788 [Jimgerdemannia flammicorona]